MDTSHMGSGVEARVEALEAKVVLYRRVVAIIVGCAVCLVAIAAMQAKRNVVTANEFRLVDKEGRVTAALVPHAPWMFESNSAGAKYDSTAQFVLAGADGKARVVMSVAPGDAGSGICLLDSMGRTRLELSLGADGPIVKCYDEAERIIPMSNWNSK